MSSRVKLKFLLIEYPKFLNEIKLHKQLATRYKTEIAEIQKVENPQERFKLKRKLP